MINLTKWELTKRASNLDLKAFEHFRGHCIQHICTEFLQCYSCFQHKCFPWNIIYFTLKYLEFCTFAKYRSIHSTHRGEKNMV